MGSRYTAVRGEAPELSFDESKTSNPSSNKTVPPQESIPLISPKWHAKGSAIYAAAPVAAVDEFDDKDDDKSPKQWAKIPTESECLNSLPPVHSASSTGLLCRLSILLGIGCSLACIICSISYWVTTSGPANIYLPKGLPGEAASFIVNMTLTQCLEGLAYVHSISLRWALLRENRLVFNTNLRLMTSSSLSQPNSWYINASSAALLILCYAATSMLFVKEVNTDDGTYGKTNLRNIPTWSSNPLNTTATMLGQQLVRHRQGRCIDSMQFRDESVEEQESAPKLPRPRQPSQWKLISTARHTVMFIWVLVGLSFVWFLAIVFVARGNMIGALNQVVEHPPNATWHFSMAWIPISNPAVRDLGNNYFFNAVLFSLDWAESTPTMPFVAALIVNLLFVCAVQGLQTLGLHFSELIVNLSRDEDVWRALNAHGGSNSDKTHVLEEAPFRAALMSWKYIMLVIFKSLLHWLLGQSSQVSIDDTEGRVFISMNCVRLLTYAICATAFASVVTFITFMEPRGPQPATYGHIQTIADAVDDWTLNEQKQFWWGDKGISREGVRHAGTGCSKEKLGMIEMDKLYAG